MPQLTKEPPVASKRELLLRLGQERKLARWENYDCLGDFHDGAYECDFVSPFTRAAHNFDAKVMILLQDWSSEDRLKGPLDEDARTLGYTPSLPTNQNLQALLLAHFRLELSDTYATNLFPFIKRGGLSADIGWEDLVRAAREFAIPQIEIVEPLIVVCLGLQTFNAVRTACGRKRAARMDEAIDGAFEHGASQIWCQAHTGAFGRKNRGGVDQVSVDWLRMANEYKRILSRPNQ